MKRAAVSFVLLAALALSGCVTLGPDYEEPDVAWLNDGSPTCTARSGNPSSRPQTDLRFWTQPFNEPVLNGLVETARRENPIAAHRGPADPGEPGRCSASPAATAIRS